MRSYTRTPLDDNAFIRLWNECKSAEQVAYILGIPVDTARHRAVTLRSEGAHLKSMRRPNLAPEDLLMMARRAGGDSDAPVDLTHREFVLLWQIAPNVATTARVAGLNPDATRTRAAQLRRSGVPLRRLSTRQKDKAQSTTRSKTYIIRCREFVQGFGHSHLKTVVRPAHWNGWNSRQWDATWRPENARHFRSEVAARRIMDRMEMTDEHYEIIEVDA